MGWQGQTCGKAGVGQEGHPTRSRLGSDSEKTLPQNVHLLVLVKAVMLPSQLNLNWS